MPAPLQSSLKRFQSIRPVHKLLLASALLILWIGNYTDIDLNLADAMFDQTSGTFPWRHTWFAERFNHVLLKGVLIAAAIGVIAVAAWDWIRPFNAWRANTRIGMRVLALSAISVPLVISTLKQFSSSHCPWDLQRYGGDSPFIRLLELVPSGVSAGNCLPAGHASSALWLVALAVFWLPHRPRKAAVVACTLLIFGFAVGWVQQLRGAHFLTHTLWSMWITILIVDSIYQWFVKRAAATRKAGDTEGVTT